MQAAYDPLHTFLDIVTPLALGLVSWVGLMFRAKLSEMGRANDKAASTLKEELVAHHVEIAQKLAVHEARDEGEFTAIRQALMRIEGRRGSV